MLVYLTPWWINVVIIIEGTKDLSSLEFDQLVRFLMLHEERLRDSSRNVNENFFSSKLHTSNNQDASSSSKRNQGQGSDQKSFKRK